LKALDKIDEGDSEKKIGYVSKNRTLYPAKSQRLSVFVNKKLHARYIKKFKEKLGTDKATILGKVLEDFMRKELGE